MVDPMSFGGFLHLSSPGTIYYLESNLSNVLGQRENGETVGSSDLRSHCLGLNSSVSFLPTLCWLPAAQSLSLFLSLPPILFLSFPSSSFPISPFSPCVCLCVCITSEHPMSSHGPHWSLGCVAALPKLTYICLFFDLWVGWMIITLTLSYSEWGSLSTVLWPG